MTLGAQLNGAKLVLYDNTSDFTLAWYGGHGIHAYTAEGLEVAYWNTGSFARNNASEEEVLESMGDRIANQDYVDFT